MITVTINNRYFVQQMINNQQFIIKRMEKLVNLISTDMRNTVKKYTPIDEGRLRNSWRVYKQNSNIGSGKYEVNIQTSVPYARFVEYGTGIYNEEGNGRQTPWLYKHKRYGVFIRTRGQKPKKFTRQGFNEVIGRVNSIALGVFK